VIGGEEGERVSIGTRLKKQKEALTRRRFLFHIHHKGEKRKGHEWTGIFGVVTHKKGWWKKEGNCWVGRVE